MSVFLVRLIQPFRFAGDLLWNRSLPTSSLLEFTQSIRFFLASGMYLRDAMRVLAERGSRSTRAVARNIATELASGWTFQAALEKQGRKFPPLFVALATVGEETGKLPEVMKDLEKYYELQRQQKSQLRSQTFLPVMQFVSAVFIIAGLIYILGQLPQSVVAGQSKPTDALGLGLIGTDGAIRFVVYVFGGVAILAIAGYLLKILLGRHAIVERFLLYVPVLGRCIYDVALTRFSFTMQLMLDSSMSILKTIRLAFQSTDNPAFIATSGRAEANLKRGNSVLTGLSESHIFPKSYLSAVAIGEESGHLPEIMRQLADYHDDRAKRGIVLINRLIGTAVWLVVAGFVIFLIFRVYSTMYLGEINKQLNYR